MSSSFNLYSPVIICVFPPQTHRNWFIANLLNLLAIYGSTHYYTAPAPPHPCLNLVRRAGPCPHAPPPLVALPPLLTLLPVRGAWKGDKRGCRGRETREGGEEMGEIEGFLSFCSSIYLFRPFLMLMILFMVPEWECTLDYQKFSKWLRVFF